MERDAGTLRHVKVDESFGEVHGELIEYLPGVLEDFGLALVDWLVIGLGATASRFTACGFLRDRIRTFRVLDKLHAQSISESRTLREECLGQSDWCFGPWAQSTK